jgi:hypothetical protein
MKLSRQSRLVAALIALIGVLFTQLAVAAYVCPSMQVAQAIEAVTMSGTAVDHRNMDGCEEADMKPAVQCPVHAQLGTQSLDKPEVPNVPPFVALALLAAITDGNVPQWSISPSVSPLVLTRTTAPPLSIQYCCFRI